MCTSPHENALIQTLGDHKPFPLFVLVALPWGCSSLFPSFCFFLGIAVVPPPLDPLDTELAWRAWREGLEGIIPDKKRGSDMMSEKKGEKGGKGGEKTYLERKKKESARRGRGHVGDTWVTLG